MQVHKKSGRRAVAPPKEDIHCGFLKFEPPDDDPFLEDSKKIGKKHYHQQLANCPRSAAWNFSRGGRVHSILSRPLQSPIGSVNMEKQRMRLFLPMRTRKVREKDVLPENCNSACDVLARIRTEKAAAKQKQTIATSSSSDLASLPSAFKIHHQCDGTAEHSSATSKPQTATFELCPLDLKKSPHKAPSSVLQKNNENVTRFEFLPTQRGKPHCDHKNLISQGFEFSPRTLYDDTFGTNFDQTKLRYTVPDRFERIILKRKAHLS